MHSLIIFGVVLVAFASPTYALSCLPCNETLCANVTCKTSVVTDECGCCPKCSKGFLEECGGPWDIFGICDPEKDLVCDKFVPPGHLDFNADGRCVKNGTQGTCTYPQVYTDCASACQSSCDERNPVICTMNCVADHCVCGPGFIRRSATNRTCVRTEECDIEPITCEFPKIREECATACPATCENPFPSLICTRNCNQDPCVCPEGFMMRSLKDRRCLRDYECARENVSFCSEAEAECRPIDLHLSSYEMNQVYACHLKKWKCNTYKWKMEMSKWWVESCNRGRDDMEYLWKDMRSICETLPNIRCKNPDATECGTDALGCYLCHCSDGRYEDPKQPMIDYKISFNAYMKFMDMYHQAKTKCVGGC